MNQVDLRAPLHFSIRSARLAGLAAMLELTQCATPRGEPTKPTAQVPDPVPAPGREAEASAHGTALTPLPRPPSSAPSDSADTAPRTAAAAATTVSVANPSPGAAPAPALGLVYYAETRDGWIEVTVPAKDIEGLRRLQQAIGGDGVLWHGDRRTPAEVRAFGQIYLLNAGAPTEARTFVALRPEISMSSDDWWILRFRRGKLEGPFLAVSDAPAPEARLRKPPKLRRTKASDPMVAHLRTGLDALDDARAAEWFDAAVARRRVTYEIQAAPGVFPGASQVVAVSASDSGDASVDPEFYGAVFTVDEAGAVVQRIDTNWGATQELQAVGDVDGDGFDDLVIRGQEYEGVDAKLVRLTPGNVDVRILLMG